MMKSTLAYADTKRPILVFGATGQQGGSVAEALLRAQWPVRALVRDPEAPKSIALRKAGVEIVRGTLADVDAIREAMKDAHGVFSVQPSSSSGTLSDEDEVRYGISIADSALESGVAHIVYSSGASVGEKPSGVARIDAKALIEKHVRELPVTATIIRPVIFMEMLARPGFGLDDGRFTFFVRPEQPMQLIAVEDIGKFVAAIFGNRNRFGGTTLRIASDTVTGRELGMIFSEAAGHEITYARFSDAVLAANPNLGTLAASLDAGPLSEHVQLDVMREINPEIVSFRSWLATSGRAALREALGNTSGQDKAIT